MVQFVGQFVGLHDDVLALAQLEALDDVLAGDFIAGALVDRRLRMRSEVPRCS
ncbi:hypothetical protein [Streptomyces coeruleorubidus]|uniref:hypothetical protein n=1 Tax=Streptomyces coeruleorubidus TaxID=116188 RepID=UPI003665FAF9